MAATLPQSVAPGVAFEIDLEKKTDSPRSAVQKRLENSPRRGEVKLEDVQSKLKRANERKDQLEAEALAQDVAQGVAEEARQRGRHRKARDDRDGGATRARRGRAPRG